VRYPVLYKISYPSKICIGVFAYNSQENSWTPNIIGIGSYKELRNCMMLI